MDLNMEMGNGMLEESFNVPISAFDYQPAPSALSGGDFFSQDLISLGLSEPLPPQQMIDDLYASLPEFNLSILTVLDINFTLTSSTRKCCSTPKFPIRASFFTPEPFLETTRRETD